MGDVDRILFWHGFSRQSEKHQKGRVDNNLFVPRVEARVVLLVASWAGTVSRTEKNGVSLATFYTDQIGGLALADMMLEV